MTELSVLSGSHCRICQGRHLADNSVFITVASVLHVFNITPARDSAGSEIPASKAFTSGYFSYVSFQMVCIYGRDVG
jgi:hypothetical protein